MFGFLCAYILSKNRKFCYNMKIMSNPEVQKRRIDYRAIADTYGYKPVPEGYSEPVPRELDIDWNAIEADMAGARNTAIQNFGKIPLKRLRSFSDIRGGFLERLQIPNIQHWSHVLEYSQRVQVDQGNRSSLILSLIDARAHEIADFVAVNEADGVWNLQHRVVDEAYRNQHLGSRMLDEMESLIQTYADEKGEDQEIVVDVGKPPVLDFF